MIILYFVLEIVTAGAWFFLGWAYCNKNWWKRIIQTSDVRKQMFDDMMRNGPREDERFIAGYTIRTLEELDANQDYLIKYKNNETLRVPNE